MIRRDEVELVFNDDEPTVVVRVRGVDVAMLVLPGLEPARPEAYDGYWSAPLRPDADPVGPDSGVGEEGEFLLATWRNDPARGGVLEKFVRLHKGRWDRGAA